MDIILQLLKIDLGITHTLRDNYFTSLINTCNAELARKGINLDLTVAEDQMLLSDYITWRYRKRQEDTGLPQNITFRIRNRIVKARSKYVET